MSLPGAAVHLVDCTLREGEQAPGVYLPPEHKLELLAHLAAAGVEVADAGMPAVDEEEREFFRRAVTWAPRPRLGASVRARRAEIELAAGLGCEEIFVIAPVSRLHLETRLRSSAERLAGELPDLLAPARAAGAGITLVAEDASRADPGDLTRIARAGVAAGAARVVLCDTVGVLTPAGTARRIAAAAAALPGVPLGIHCHNDLGMATANTVAAVEAGAGWITATVNGIGERAGAASLAEVAVAIEDLLGRPTGVRRAALLPLARAVEHGTGLLVPPHQPLVGAHAFRHESGIHVDGLLKDPATYEGIAPAPFGRRHELVFGKHGGRAHVRALLAGRGLTAGDEVVDRIVARLKRARAERDRQPIDALLAEVDRFYAGFALSEEVFWPIAREELDR